MKNILFLIICITQVIVSGVNAQVRYEDDYYDYGSNSNWYLSGGIGTIFFEGYEEKLLPPLLSLKLEHRFDMGLAPEIEVAYFQHGFQNDNFMDSMVIPVEDDVTRDLLVGLFQDGDYTVVKDSVKSLLFSLGINHYLNNGNPVVFYLSADFGYLANSVDLRIVSVPPPYVDFDANGTRMETFAQVGGGVDFDLGPLNLGVAYGYFVQNGYDTNRSLIMVSDQNPGVKKRNGHRLELKIGGPVF